MSQHIPLPKISQPAMRALATIGVQSLEQLIQFTESEVFALHGMGPKAMRTLKEVMAQHNLSFKA